MCRLFGFKSVFKSQVHKSLIGADNALGPLSKGHPDGWGVAYYQAGAPHLIRSEKTAIHDNLFQRLSGLVSSETVIAHIRKATLGQINILNTHPFQYGHWIFAHNGNIKNFEQHKKILLEKISPELRPFVLGSTDSEIIFFSILTSIQKKHPLDRKDISVDAVTLSINEALKDLTNIIGPVHETSNGTDKETYLSFVISNGPIMLAHHGGKDLYYSTYKKSCSERDTCTHFSNACENESSPNDSIKHILFSSEPLEGENIWPKMKLKQLVGVDSEMNFKSYDLVY